MSHTEVIEVGKYKFNIIRNIQALGGIIYIHTYKIGGDHPNCINISYRYEGDIPKQALLPYLLYEPECAVGSFLEKGSGTELLIKAAIRYAYKDVPTIGRFEFDDDSHIDCIPKDMTKQPPRKPMKPLNLAFFSIAYHDRTWYEARFNAKMIDVERYVRYRKSLQFLTDPVQKLPFFTFLQIIGDSINSMELLSYLESIYVKARTYREFFEGIPKTKRCEVLFGWLNRFMKHYIGSTFTDKGWFIDVTTMASSNTIQKGGNLSRIMKYRIFSYNSISSF